MPPKFEYKLPKWHGQTQTALLATGHWHSLVEEREGGAGLGGHPSVWAASGLWCFSGIIRTGFANTTIATSGQMPQPIWLNEFLYEMPMYWAHYSMSYGVGAGLLMMVPVAPILPDLLSLLYPYPRCFREYRTIHSFIHSTDRSMHSVGIHCAPLKNCKCSHEWDNPPPGSHGAHILVMGDSQAKKQP